jgi:hypothetical protein
MMRYLIFLLFCTTFGLPALGAGASSPIKEIYFNLGTHTEFFNAVQKDDSGGLRKFDLAPTIGAGLGLPIDETFIFLPEFNWVLPQMMENSNIMINTFMLRGDIGYDALDWLRLRLGTSLMWQNQQGKGGKTQLNNGEARSTFYYPDENRSSLNNTLDVGVETIFDEYAIRLQTYTYSVFRKEQRQISYTLFFTYYWEKQK